MSRPHQPDQGHFHAIRSEDLEWKSFPASTSQDASGTHIRIPPLARRVSRTNLFGVR
jgi:hypothetical protein